MVNSGLIHGGQVGVQFANGGSLDNAGTISGGVDGVKLGKSGTLTNETGGVITGLTGILVNGAAIIENAGTIAASAGGNAISLSNGASSVTLETGSEIDGAIAGNGTASTIALDGHGSLSSNITGLQAGQLTVQQNAVWTVSGNWAVGQVVNAGTLTAGLVGTPLTISGDYTQTSTGTLHVVVTPDGMNHLVVSGSAHLAGTLAYELSPGTYAPTSYSFLTAAGGISGDFTSVDTSDASQHSRSAAGVTNPSSSGDPVTISAAQDAFGWCRIHGGALHNAAFGRGTARWYPVCQCWAGVGAGGRGFGAGAAGTRGR